MLNLLIYVIIWILHDGFCCLFVKNYVNLHRFKRGYSVIPIF